METFTVGSMCQIHFLISLYHHIVDAEFVPLLQYVDYLVILMYE